MLSILFVPAALAQPVDVERYKFNLELSDRHDTILGHAAITVRFTGTATEVSFDLIQAKGPGSGMYVIDMHGPSVNAGFADAENNKCKLQFSKPFKAGDTATFNIKYKGVPADGLIISRNKFGDRTFFSDNWPNRAPHWIPCIDNVADKAAVEFLVTAPINFKTVSNGILVTEKTVTGNKRFTHWREDIPLPTKIMVIGVADFSVDTAGVVDNIPVTSWVFPQNKKEGFYDYARAKDVLAFFVNYIGPYPYKKLANIQSKTIFGGMENASAIFYYENSVTGYREEESLLAHEIAHQWFGDMVTEKSYRHVWLSEGFATYLNHIYLETKYGYERMQRELIQDRLQVRDFIKVSNQPVIDTATPVMQLLNANSYQKAGWVLHMLRREVGDSNFKKCLRGFYFQYAGKNADTRDFQKVCEEVTGKNLESFFQQWLYTPGIPIIKLRWKFSSDKKRLTLRVEQLQKTPFQFPLDIKLQYGSSRQRIETLAISRDKQEFEMAADSKPGRISLDPNTWLLFEGEAAED